MSDDWKCAQVPAFDCLPIPLTRKLLVFAKACDATYRDLFITLAERDAAIEKYRAELLAGPEETKHG